MNKAMLIAAVAKTAGFDNTTAKTAVEAVLDVIVRAVVNDERVTVTGFGSFYPAERPAHKARNPQNGDTVRVKKTTVPRFRPGQGFKDLTDRKRRLPQTGSAVKKAPKGSRSRAA